MSGPPTAEGLAALQHMQLELLQTSVVSLAVFSVVFGIFLSQVVTFFRLFPNERIAFKALVFSLLLLECAYFALSCVHVFQFATDTVNQKVALFMPSNSDLALNWILTVITWVCEGYFTYLTVKVAAKNWPVRIIAVVLWCFEFGAFLGLSVIHTQKRDLRVHELSVIRSVGVWSLFTIAAFTSSVLTYYLIVKREVKPSDDILTKFAKAVIGTSGLLALGELIGAIATIFNPQRTAVLMGTFLTSFYATTAAVCVLWNLNHRAKLRRFDGQNNKTWSGSGAKPVASRWTTSETGAARVHVTREETTVEEREEVDLEGEKRMKRRVEEV